MKNQYLLLLRKCEKSWWYRNRVRVVNRLLKKYLYPEKHMILDIGSGFGGMYEILKKFGTVIGVEPDIDTKDVLVSRGYEEIFQNISDISSRKFSLVCLFDVLEHIQDDRDVLSKIYNVLFDDGMLSITVPAYQWLWSEHDISHQHFRRYTKKTLTIVLTEAGFQPLYVGYWNTFLFPMACASRFFGSSGKSALFLPRIFDTILYGIVLIESILIPHFKLPFGLTVIAIAKKIPKRSIMV